MFVVCINTLSVISSQTLSIAMKNRRSKLEIYLDVLQLIKEGTAKPTRIMYGANLSWNILQGTLENMIDQGLITEIDQSRSKDKRTSKTYEVTSRGDSVIRYFGHAKQLIDLEGEDSFNPLHIARTQ